jgi:hypothetical protein
MCLFLQRKRRKGDRLFNAGKFFAGKNAEFFASQQKISLRSPQARLAAAAYRTRGGLSPPRTPPSASVPLSSTQKEERRPPFLLKLQLLAFLDLDDFTAIVLSAFRAGAVRHTECSAVGALYKRGGSELPGGRPSLVTSLSGYFSFWDRHIDTSNSSSCFEQLFVMISSSIYPEAAQAQPF